MKVLVTGGLGYIGGRLVEALERDEAFVPIVHARHLLADGAKADFRVADFADPSSIAGLCEGVDAVVHLASLDEQTCAAEPVRALQANVLGTYHLLQEALRAGVKRLVYVSTFHVYGPNNGPHYHEGLVPAPLHHYGITRLMAEQYVRQAGDGGQLQTVVARLSNGFGAPVSPTIARWGLVFNDLSLQAVRDGKLVLETPGLQQRDFVPMNDVVSGIQLLLRSELEHDIYHVGSGRPQTILQAAGLVQDVYRELYGANLLIEAPDAGDDERHIPVRFDISRLQDLGFEPSRDWRGEIARTLKLCQAHLADIGV